MKREQGAHATLLGVAVRPPAAGEPGRWRALAVGDSCLFRVRHGFQPRAFPLTKAADFGNQPRLLPSRPAKTQLAPTFDRGACEAGDRLLLMTDALAQWFLQACEGKRQPWVDLDRLLCSPKRNTLFPTWIEQRRDKGDLRNDDVTLLAVGPMPAAGGR
jgi:hypothetical protein